MTRESPIMPGDTFRVSYTDDVMLLVGVELVPSAVRVEVWRCLRSGPDKTFIWYTIHVTKDRNNGCELALKGNAHAT